MEQYVFFSLSLLFPPIFFGLAIPLVFITFFRLCFFYSLLSFKHITFSLTVFCKKIIQKLKYGGSRDHIQRAFDVLVQQLQQLQNTTVIISDNATGNNNKTGTFRASTGIPTPTTTTTTTTNTTTNTNSGASESTRRKLERKQTKFLETFKLPETEQIIKGKRTFLFFYHLIPTFVVTVSLFSFAKTFLCIILKFHRICM